VFLIKVDINLTQALQSLLESEVEKIKNGNYFTIVLIAVLLVSYWLFIAFRKTYIDSKNKDTDFMNESLKTHSSAIFIINSYLNNTSNILDLNKSLEILIYYCQPSSMSLINEWLKSNDEMHLHKLYEEIIVELKNLKDIQIFSYKKHSIDSFLYEFAYSIKRSNVDTLVLPLVYTFFSLFASLLFSLIVLNDVGGKFSTFYKISIVITLFSIFITLVNFDLFFHGKLSLSKNKSIYISTVIYLLLYVLLFLKISYITILWLIYSVIYIFITFRNLSK
jgi:hypothetical protein